MDKGQYIRTYKKTKYNEDLVKSRQYQNSLRYKLKNNISEEIWNKYKHQLYDVSRLKDILALLPIEVILEIIQENQSLNVVCVETH